MGLLPPPEVPVAPGNYEGTTRTETAGAVLRFEEERLERGREQGLGRVGVVGELSGVEETGPGVLGDLLVDRIGTHREETAGTSALELKYK